MKNKECFFSSLFFLINAIIAYQYKYYSYSLSFLFLVITSLFHHYYYTNITRQIDRIVIIIIAYYTIMIFYEKYKAKKINFKYIILYGIICLFNLFLFAFGGYTNQYCFDKDHTTACLWHSLLHLITCIGGIILILI